MTTGAGAINSPFAEYQLKSQLVNTTITTDYLNVEGITMNPHVFVGVTFTDSNGAAVTPGAGTYTVTAETLNNPGVFQTLVNGSTIDATAALTTLSAGANITRFRVVSASITTATLLNIKITANVS